MYHKYILYISLFISFSLCDDVSLGKTENVLSDPVQLKCTIEGEEIAENLEKWETNYELAIPLGEEALKHIEAKYPHSKKRTIVRIVSLEKQGTDNTHYRLKVEVGFTDCVALSGQTNCKLDGDSSSNKLCHINMRSQPCPDQLLNFEVSCEGQEAYTELQQNLQAELLFNNFLSTHNPNYKNNRTETERRLLIFKENIKKIHEFNINEKGSATYGITRFADLTYEEFKNKYTGLKAGLKNENLAPLPKAVTPNIELPTSFDWRESGAVTGVKDQGACGSCWAFTVTGNIEGLWKIKSGKLESLSEQQLVDCDKLDDGCDGGMFDTAYRAIEQLGGLELESDYPYTADEDEDCTFNKTMAKVQIRGGVNITSNEIGMAQWLVKNGPISIAINAIGMQYYKGGVSHPSKKFCDPNDLYHGMLIVGYGIEEHGLFKKQIPYWILKNSYSTLWGEQGYGRVYRGDGTCGLNKMPCSAVL